MSKAIPDVTLGHDTVWWAGGGLMKITARAADTAGALGALDARIVEAGYGPPLHVHSREDEVAYVLDGQIRFRVGDDEFVAGPGTWVWQPRGVPHSFRVESESARALMLFTPGGIERMFEQGGAPAGASNEPPQPPQPDADTAAALAAEFGFEVVGPQLG